MKFLFNDTYRDQFDGLPMCIQKQLVARLVKRGTPEDQVNALVGDEVFEMLDRQLKLYLKRKEKSRVYAAKKRGAAFPAPKPDNAVEVMGAEDIPAPAPAPAPPPRLAEPTLIESDESDESDEEGDSDDYEPEPGEVVVPRGIDTYERKDRKNEKETPRVPTANTSTLRDSLLSFIM